MLKRDKMGNSSNKSQRSDKSRGQQARQKEHDRLRTPVNLTEEFDEESSLPISQSQTKAPVSNTVHQGTQTSTDDTEQLESICTQVKELKELLMRKLQEDKTEVQESRKTLQEKDQENAACHRRLENDLQAVLQALKARDFGELRHDIKTIHDDSIKSMQRQLNITKELLEKDTEKKMELLQSEIKETKEALARLEEGGLQPLLKTLKERDIELKHAIEIQDDGIKHLQECVEESKQLLEKDVENRQERIESLQSEIKNAKEALERLLENHFKTTLKEHDFSELKHHIKTMQDAGIKSLQQFMEETKHLLEKDAEILKKMESFHSEMREVKENLARLSECEKKNEEKLQDTCKCNLQVLQHVKNLQESIESVRQSVEKVSKPKLESESADLETSRRNHLTDDMSEQEDNSREMREDMKRIKNMLEATTSSENELKSVVGELKEAIVRLPREQERGDSTSHGMQLQVWQANNSVQCSDCERLRRQLKEKDLELRRMADQINAEMKKMQGVHGRVNCEQIFKLFFSNKVDTLVMQSGIKDKERKREMTEELCVAFQSIFDVVKKLIIGQIMMCFETLFEPETSKESTEHNDLIKAYSRLLSAAGLIGECQITSSQVELKPLKMNIHTSVNKEEFMNECVKLSWQLVTNVPPMISTCSEKHYDQHKHSLIPGSVTSTASSIVKYTSPILMSSSGKVLAEGLVRMTKPRQGRVDIYSQHV